VRTGFAYAGVLISAALVLAVIVLGGAPKADEQAVLPKAPKVLLPPGRASQPHLYPRPFLSVFLRYEVGASGADLRRALRASATADFAAELLATQPHAPSGTSAARIAHLRTTYFSRNPPRALVAGTALRARRPEQFAFLFEARHGRWLAAGPAE
jgi:hypothetical protein